MSPRGKLSTAKNAEPYCSCWQQNMKLVGPLEMNTCSCGEEDDIKEWRWEKPADSVSDHVVLSENNQLVTFHPNTSSGTAFVKGDTPMEHNYHYYWEVKMLTNSYGTDIMVGVGSDKVDILEYRHKFTSGLGKTIESYGLSYTGRMLHASMKIIDRRFTGFCRGDMLFYNLRRHSVVYPMVCSTAVQSSFKIVYASSWKASLLVDALKILSASAKGDKIKLPLGLRNQLKSQFWITMPSYAREDALGATV
ncbi:SPRY domain-containing SOCS box protein, partial [Operophtera brumata]